MTTNEFWLTCTFVTWPIMAVIGALLGTIKGRAGAGALLGVLIGPIGWLVVLLGPDRRARSVLPPHRPVGRPVGQPPGPRKIYTGSVRASTHRQGDKIIVRRR